MALECKNCFGLLPTVEGEAIVRYCKTCLGKKEPGHEEIERLLKKYPHTKIYDTSRLHRGDE